MHCGGGGPSEQQRVNRRSQGSVADLISVAGHSLWLHQTPMEAQCFGGAWSTGNSNPRRSYVLETLLCPRPGPLNASGLCRETLLGSVELGEGAAAGHLVTPHQDSEQERQSNQSLGLRAIRPDAPSQSALYR